MAAINPRPYISPDAQIEILDRDVQEGIDNAPLHQYLVHIIAESLPEEGVPEIVARYADRSGKLGALANISRSWLRPLELLRLIPEVIPPTPPNIGRILASPCPFYPGRSVFETHTLYFLPEGRPEDIYQRLINYGNTPASTLKHRGRNPFRTQLLLETPIPQLGQTLPGRWVLALKGIVPGSANREGPETKSKTFEEQKKILAKLCREKGCHYVVASANDLALSSFFQKMAEDEQVLESGKGMETADPQIFVRTSDTIDGRPVVVRGDFYGDGLVITRDPSKDYMFITEVGISAVRVLEPRELERTYQRQPQEEQKGVVSRLSEFVGGFFRKKQ